MKYIIITILLFVISTIAYSQDDILNMAKLGMSTDDLLTAFKDQGIAQYKEYDRNNDNDNDRDNDSDSDDDNNNNHDNQRNKYRISSYSMVGNDYNVTFYTERNKLKKVQFNLSKSLSDKAKDVFDKWVTDLKAKYGSMVNTHDYSYGKKTELNRDWQSGNMRVSLHYFQMGSDKYCDLSYYYDN
ncbi:hypothetical protein BH10BAC5_BH10BAC5_16080 [soil metagenome]